MIKIQNLVKRYGKNTALNNVDLLLDENKIYCLLGRNGAGKTTLMRCIAGYEAATSGNIIVDGTEVDTFNMHKDIKFIKETAKHFNISIKELFKASKSFNSNWNEEFALNMIKTFKLDLKKKFGELSFGMKSMVNAIIALSSQTKYTFLDEPVVGFDPIIRQHFYDLVSKANEEFPRTIIISTHMVDEVASIVDNVIILDEGKVFIDESYDDFNEKSYLLIGPKDIINETIQNLNVLSTECIGQYIIANIFDEKPNYIEESVSFERASLQKTFIHLLGGNKNEKN